MVSESGEFYKVSKEEVIKLHKKYKSFYKNRISVTNKSNINQSYKNIVDYSFQPELFSQNDELAEKWRNNHREPGKIEDNLLAEQAKKEKKLQQLKQKFDAEQYKECSFKPKTEELPTHYIKSTTDYSKISDELDPKQTHKGVILYTLASKNKEKKEKNSKTSKEIQEEKDLEECTFSPNILDKGLGSFNNFTQRMQANEDIKKAKSPRNSIKSVNKSSLSNRVIRNKLSCETSMNTDNLEYNQLEEIKESLEDNKDYIINKNSDLGTTENEHIEEPNENIMNSEINNEEKIKKTDAILENSAVNENYDMATLLAAEEEKKTEQFIEIERSLVLELEKKIDEEENKIENPSSIVSEPEKKGIELEIPASDIKIETPEEAKPETALNEENLEIKE